MIQNHPQPKKKYFSHRKKRNFFLKLEEERFLDGVKKNNDFGVRNSIYGWAMVAVL